MLPPRPTPAELPALMEGGALVVDIRPVGQRERDGELAGAVVIDRNVLEWRLDPTSPHRIAGADDPDRQIVVVCNEGYASSLAAATLRQLGLRRATDLAGGFQAVLAMSSGPPGRRMAMTTRNPLDVLVGEWSMTARFEHLPAAEGDARVVFEWLPGEQFLVQRWSVPVPEAPDGIAIIGSDPAGEGRYLQHYFDSRGVARVYRMTLAGNVWTLWRDEPDFSPLDFRQRYVGTIGDDETSITGAWEICHDGVTWEHDFELSYTKIPQ
jgi:rhodanese-related sulfurtransferase